MVVLRVLRRAVGSKRGIVAWFGLLGAILAGWCVLQRAAIVDYLDTLERRNREKRGLEETQAEIRALETERDELRHGGARQEIEQRERYVLAGEGEKVVVVEGHVSASAPSSATAPTRSRREKMQEKP